MSQPALPSEIILHITRFITWDGCIQPPLETVYIPTKANFPSGFSLSCKTFNQVLNTEWFYLLRLNSAQDWDHAQQAQITHHIRILILTEKALAIHVSHKLNLSQLENVRIMVVDCHNDVGCSSTSKGQWSYKKVMPRLPKNLKSLIVSNAHGPDLQIIQQAVDQCPNLEDLCLGRCTKFNRPNNCDFWKKFPGDHDSYFSNKGIEGYAKALGTELTRLKRLKSIYVNVYLTDTKHLSNEETSTSAQMISLRQEPNSPEKSSDSDRTRISNERSQTSQGTPQIPLLEKNDQEKTKDAEVSAAWVLFDSHKELCSVAFVSYWSPNHLAWSSHSRSNSVQDYKNLTAASNDSSPTVHPDPGGDTHYLCDTSGTSPNCKT